MSKRSILDELFKGPPFPRRGHHGVVRAVVSGLRRQLAVAQQQKTALEIDPLRVVLAQIPGDVGSNVLTARYPRGWRFN